MEWTPDVLNKLRCLVLAAKTTTGIPPPRRTIRSRQSTPTTATESSSGGRQPDSTDHALLCPPPLTPLPIRTPHHFSHTEPSKARVSRRKWQDIARSLGHGCNYRAARYVWRTLKQNEAREAAAVALDNLERLTTLVPTQLKEAKTARQGIYTTGGGNDDHPWSPSQLRNLEQLALEHTKKKFRGDKKRRWQHIQKELGLADRSFKSCQRAFRAVVSLQRAADAALDRFDTSRRLLAEAKKYHETCHAYEISCDKKTLEASQRITTQANLDRELRLTAHLTRGEHDMEGRPQALALLLSRGADPDAADSGGFSALMAAARINACGAVSVLLDHGASIDLTDADGHTALFHALEGGGAQAARLLLRRGATHGDSSDHARGLAYGALVGEQIEKFVASERKARDAAERERRWFVSFEERYSHHEASVGGQDSGRNMMHSRTDKLTLRSLKQWPPKLPPSRRRPKRGSGTGGVHIIGGSTRLPSGGGQSSRQSSSARSHQSVLQLTAPTALDALRLGLEGSRQRKDRLQREGNEVVRQQVREAVAAARPPTYERNMISAQGHTTAALTGVAEVLKDHREALHRARAYDMHRANTALR